VSAPAVVRLAGYGSGDGDGDRVRPVLVWAPGPGWRAISSGVEGGGIGERRWWLNAQVDRDYRRTDPDRHVRELAAGLHLSGPGVGLLTAADVRHRTAAEEAGVHAVATVGLGLPVRAAAPDDVVAAESAPGCPPAPGILVPGTINVLVVVPVALTDAALVNAVITVTEAKAQALGEAGVPGTGTSSDAVCIACPAVPAPGGTPEPFAGPRAPWGLRIARTVHRAVADGTAGWLDRHPSGDEHRPWRRSSPPR